MENLKKISIIDIAIFLAIIIALVVGIFTVKHFRQTAGKQIESTSKILFQVFVRGATLTNNLNPIVKDDEAFITIRNVPYTSLKILDSQIDTKKVVIPDTKTGKDFMIAPDYSQVCMYDILVTFEDEAKITKDGPVVGGNKIKIGLPITLEGKLYKFSGTVSNVIILGENQTAPQQLQKAAQEPAKEISAPITQPVAAKKQTAVKAPAKVVKKAKKTSKKKRK